MAEDDTREQTDDGSGTATKKSATKKSAAKKATKRAPAKKSGESRQRAPRTEPQRRSGRPKAAAVAAEAARQFAELSGKDVEGVAGLRRTDEGWVVDIDVLELRRIPETTDVLAGYEVEVDEDGDLTGYRRVHRYVRGKVEDGP